MFKITLRGRAHYFPTLDAARAAANDYFRRTGVVLGIEAAKPRTRFSRDSLRLIRELGYAIQTEQRAAV